MEGEIKNLMVVWLVALASLCYCHTIAKFISKGITRLFAIIPIICLFLYLPLNLTTIHLGAITGFFLAWLGNFKLLLFAFGNGPLSTDPPISLPHFILLASLPIKVQNQTSTPNSEKPQNTKIKQYPSHQVTKQCLKSPLNYATKIMLLATLVQVYEYKKYVHPTIIMLLFNFHIYLMLELVLALFAALARALVQLELEPQFGDPYLCTSLQDFWGRRWNLMVTSILRPTIYDPVRSISTRLIGRKWAPLPAVLATFFVSGVMHELIFYYIGRFKPTLEITCYFLINGLCLAMEISIKKAVNGKFRLPPVVSGALVQAFLVVTSLWLFLPPVLRFNADIRARGETAAFVEFVKDVAGVSRFRYFNVISG